MILQVVNDLTCVINRVLIIIIINNTTTHNNLTFIVQIRIGHKCSVACLCQTELFPASKLYSSTIRVVFVLLLLLLLLLLMMNDDDDNDDDDNDDA